MGLTKKHFAAIVLLIFLSGMLGYAIGIDTRSDKYLAGEANAEGSVTNKQKYSVHDLEDVDFSLYWDVWETISRDFYDQPVSEKELFYSSLRGLVAGLQDPYSIFLDPPETEEFNGELAGNFEGIGAEIGFKNNQLTIIAPLPDTPASRAGLLAGDSILGVDGLDTSFMTLNEAVRLIRGPRGSDVVLTIVRAGDSVVDFQDITVTRDVIHVKSVTMDIRDDGIAVIKISNFNEDTRTLFAEAAKDIISNPSVTGIILDLRNNPGGFLDTAVKVVGYWTGDETVVYEEFSDGSQNEYQAGINPILNTYDTVVLINEGSASASEIVAGALRDYELAILIGETTFGKGTVQTLQALPDGSSIKYTIAEWLTPKGSSINEVGVDPDVIVERTVEDYENDIDPQFDAAITNLSQ